MNHASATLVDLASREDFTLHNYQAVAWDGARVRFAPAALTRITECRRAFLALLEHEPGITIYGVTSGYGQRAYLKFTPAERAAHAARPAYASAAAFGEALPERITRGIAFARLANFVEGHAAVSAPLAERAAAMLDGPLPPVPAAGNVSAGEILPLSHLYLPLAESSELGEKEMLALINGSPCASALVADVLLAARRRLARATEVFALSIEALGAPLEAYDAALDTLWNDPYEAAVLAELRRLTAGGAATRRPYQAPVSWRILPRILGQARRALAQAEEAAVSSLRAVSDNPVYLAPDSQHPYGRVLSNGGYHNAKASPAIDALAGSWADLALLSDRHVSKLLDGNVSLLPNQLVQNDGYLGCLGFVAADWAERARQGTQRTALLGSEGGGFGQNDMAAPVFMAWEKETRAAHCLDATLAILAGVASQALYVTERPAPPALAELLGEVRACFAPVDGPRALGPDAGRLADWFGAQVLANGIA